MFPRNSVSGSLRSQASGTLIFRGEERSQMRLLLAFCFFAVPAFAQVDTGSIVGNVHDTSGAVVGSASVTVDSQATNGQWKVQSDDKGEYVSPPLRVGVYSVRVEA